MFPSPSAGAPPGASPLIPQTIQVQHPQSPAAGGGSNGPDSPSAAAALSDAEQAIHNFVRVEQDPQDKQTALKALTILQSISAGRAKERDQALGISPQLKAAQRAAQG